MHVVVSVVDLSFCALAMAHVMSLIELVLRCAYVCAQHYSAGAAAHATSFRTPAILVVRLSICQAPAVFGTCNSGCPPAGQQGQLPLPIQHPPGLHCTPFLCRVRQLPDQGNVQQRSARVWCVWGGCVALDALCRVCIRLWWQCLVCSWRVCACRFGGQVRCANGGCVHGYGANGRGATGACLQV